MIFNLYLAQQVAGERRKDAMREAEQERLIRAVQGPRRAPAGRLREASILSSPRPILTDRRGDEPRRRSPSTASSTT